MKTVKLTKNFWLHEFIPENLYRLYIHKPHLLIGLLDWDLIEGTQLLRNDFGVFLINTWYEGQERNWSGIRTPDSPYYSALSQHTYGRAGDIIPLDTSAEEIREYLKEGVNYQKYNITCIEEKPNAPKEDDLDWLHIDTRYHTFGGLLIINP